MNKQVREFLNTILKAQSITKDIREEALMLRDAMDLCEAKAMDGVGFEYQGMMNGRRYTKMSLIDIKACENHARTLGNSTSCKKIYFIKALRKNYDIGLMDAKTLAEWLYEKGIANYI